MLNIRRLFGSSSAVPVGAAAVLSCALYAGSLANGFVFDDTAYLSTPALLGLDWAELILGNWRGLDLYRPLTLLSLAIDHALWGAAERGQLAAAGFHGTNVALHGGAVLLVGQLAHSLHPDRRAAFVAAVAFGAHPLLSEVVGWISTRGDLLSTALVLAGLVAHLRYRETGNGGGRWRGVCLACCALAPLAKETGAVLPILAWWLDRCHEPAPRPSLIGHGVGWLRAHVDYLAVLAAVLILRAYVIAGGPEAPQSANFLADASLPARWATAVAILGRYAALTVAPIRLSADYSYDSIPVSGPLDVWLFVGAGILAAVLLAAGRQRGVPAFAAGAVVICWLPVSNLLVLAPSAMAERYVYPGFFGVCLGLGMLSRHMAAAATPWRQVGAVLSLSLLVFWCFRTYERQRDWRDDGTLFRAALEVFPRNARALENLGQYQARHGDLSGAVHLYREALVIRPDNLRGLVGLGLLEIRRGRLPEAALALRGALEVKPDHLPALLDLAGVLERLGQRGEAVRRYEQVLALVPGHDQARAGRARLRPQSRPGPR